MALIFTVSCKDNKKTDGMDGQNGMGQDTMMNDNNMDENGMNQDMENQRVVVQLEPKSDSDVSGEVVFWEENGKVTMEATVMGLAEGTHAIHIHETADCSAADGSSAGGHWNPTFKPHGKWGAAEGYHKGDIGNFEANADGKGTITMSTDEWCIGCGDEKKDVLGHAIIVHEGVDDYTSQPSGNAGGRIACGGIIEM
jgi:Cu-Zn family superoxide dismutase